LQQEFVMGISQDTLRQLAKYDTPTICNVIELFEVRCKSTGYMDHRIKSCFPEMPPMVGFAATAAFRSAAPPDGGAVYGSLHQQLDQMATLDGPPVIVIQDLDDPPAAAVFGEVMCSTYRAFGAAGLVTSGAGRDLAQVRALGFPVFTGGTICSHGHCHLLHIGLPVRVGGHVVRTGELLHGDENGVTDIPSDIAADVADVAEEFVAAEKDVLLYMQGEGEKNKERGSELLKELSAAVAALKKRVTRGK
jgi:regulator of RNase E activity RraA